MTARRRKKVLKHRGNHTHGWGAKKKHRGSGNRGGKGMAGSGKRADQKKPSIWKDKSYFGKHGFTSKSRTKVNAINITYLDMNADSLVAQKLISKEKDMYVVDLEKMGYNKLLGTGKVQHKFKITVLSASAKAVEKVAEQGGQVISESVEQTQ